MQNGKLHHLIRNRQSRIRNLLLPKMKKKSDGRKNPKFSCKRMKRHLKEGRYTMRVMFWEKVKVLLQEFLKKEGRGGHRLIARELGLDSTDIHRFICPDCEHYVEPTFSVGMGIMCFLEAYKSIVKFKVDKPHETIFQEVARSKWASYNSHFDRVKRVAVIREGNDWQTIQLN